MHRLTRHAALRRCGLHLGGLVGQASRVDAPLCSSDAAAALHRCRGPWLSPVAGRGFAAAGAAPSPASASAKRHAPPQYADEGQFMPQLPDGRQVWRPHAAFSLRARVPSLQGHQFAQLVPVWRLDGTPTGREVMLCGDAFDAPIRPDLVHRCVLWQLAKKRQGTHAAKDRGQVSGTGKKPWPQKGTGRARAGSKRAPQFRGGGAVHAPRTRSHATELPRKVRRAALRSALSARLAEGRLVVVDAAEPEGGKTASLVAALSSLAAARGAAPVAGSFDTAGEGGGESGDEAEDVATALESSSPAVASPTARSTAHVPSTLVVDATPAVSSEGGVALRRAAANLRRVHVLPSHGLNVYSILAQGRTLVITEGAAEEVAARLRAPIRR